MSSRVFLIFSQYDACSLRVDSDDEEAPRKNRHEIRVSAKDLDDDDFNSEYFGGMEPKTKAPKEKRVRRPAPDMVSIILASSNSGSELCVLCV